MRLTLKQQQHIVVLSQHSTREEIVLKTGFTINQVKYAFQKMQNLKPIETLELKIIKLFEAKQRGLKFEEVMGAINRENSLLNLDEGKAWLRKFLLKYPEYKKRTVRKSFKLFKVVPNTSLTLKSKLEIARSAQELSVSEVAKSYDVAPQQVRRYKSNEEVLELYATMRNSTCTQINPAVKYQNAEEEALRYIRERRDPANPKPVRRVDVQSRLKRLGPMLEGEEFKASDGWVRSLLRRNNLKTYTLHGEGASANQEVVDRWVAENSDLVRSYNPHDIYNCDETGLNFLDEGNTSLEFASRKVKGCKRKKERVTIHLTCSLTGEKYKPLFIGKSRRPRCFNGEIPDNYTWQTSAWMNRPIFQKWYDDFSEWVGNRYVLLLMDNFSGHIGLRTHPNVRVLYLPGNTTALAQPLDSGVIQLFKQNYKRALIARGIKPDVRQVMNMATQAWYSIEKESMLACFRRICFIE